MQRIIQAYYVNYWDSQKPKQPCYTRKTAQAILLTWILELVMSKPLVDRGIVHDQIEYWRVQVATF